MEPSQNFSDFDPYTDIQYKRDLDKPLELANPDELRLKHSLHYDRLTQIVRISIRPDVMRLRDLSGRIIGFLPISVCSIWKGYHYHTLIGIYYDKPRHNPLNLANYYGRTNHYHNGTNPNDSTSHSNLIDYHDNDETKHDESYQIVSVSSEESSPSSYPPQSTETPVISKPYSFYITTNPTEVLNEIMRPNESLINYVIRLIKPLLYEDKLGCEFFLLCQLYVHVKDLPDEASELRICTFENLEKIWHEMRMKRNEIFQLKLRMLRAQFEDCDDEIIMYCCLHFKCTRKVRYMPYAVSQSPFCVVHHPLTDLLERRYDNKLSFAAQLIHLLLPEDNYLAQMVDHFRSFKICCFDNNKFDERFKVKEKAPLEVCWRGLMKYNPTVWEKHMMTVRKFALLDD
jgi:hypothetical protein